MARAVSLARKIVAKDAFGSPRGFLMNAVANKTIRMNDEGMPLDGQRIPLGSYVGIAKGVKVTNNEDKVTGEYKTYYGLAGDFQAIPHDPERPATRAPVIYLPEHIHEMVASALKDDGRGNENPDGSDSVSFVFEVGIKTNSGSSTGFTWEFTPKMETTAHDPLAELLALVTPAPAPAIENKGTETVTSPASASGAPEAAPASGAPEAAPASDTAKTGRKRG